MAPKTNKDGAKAAAKAKVEKAKQVRLSLRVGSGYGWGLCSCSRWMVGLSHSIAKRDTRRMQSAADKTFGLKNKSKSKVVKQCVARRLICLSQTQA